MGQKIIFGTDDPEGALGRGEAPIGKGQCPLCHQFFSGQKADRCPNLIALPTENPADPEKLLQMTEEESPIPICTTNANVPALINPAAPPAQASTGQEIIG